MKSARLWSFSLAAALVLLLRTLASEAACHPCSKIVLPVVLNLTGPQAFSGHLIRAGAEIAVAQINSQGGVDHVQIEINVFDAESSPARAVSLVAKLTTMQPKPGVIFVALSTAQVLAMDQQLQQLRVPAVVELARGNSVTTGGNPWMFRLSLKGELEARTFEAYVERLGIKHASLLFADATLWRENTMAFQEMLKRKGVEVKVPEVVSVDTTDLRAPLSRIRSDGADTLFASVLDRQLPELLGRAREVNLKSRIVVIGAEVQPGAVRGIKGIAPGSTYFTVSAGWMSEDVEPTDKVGKAFFEEWKKRGFAPQDAAQGSRGYDGVSTIVEAIRVSGRWDPVRMREGLWKVNFVGIGGPIKFERDGPSGRESGQRQPSLRVIEIRDGKERLLQ